MIDNEKQDPFHLVSVW